MDKKQLLGQFNTTNRDYILHEFEDVVKGKDWVDPYAGNGDLLDWAKANGANTIQGYDIDPTKNSRKDIELRDSFRNPVDYTGKWIIANPPYLAQNKNKEERDKGAESIYLQKNEDDLYKIALKTVAEGDCEGGIFIVPLNFLSSENSRSIRNVIFSKYCIRRCKAFEETVFDDTDYTVCAFYFEKRKKYQDNDEIVVDFLPSKEFIVFRVSHEYGWILGEAFYEYLKGVSLNGVGRWTVKNGSDEMRPLYEEDKNKPRAERRALRGTVYINSFSDNTKYVKGKEEDSQKGHHVRDGRKPNTYYNSAALDNIILIRAIDTGSLDGRIQLEDIRTYGKRTTLSADPQVQQEPWAVMLGLETSRNLAHVKFDKPPSKEDQERIIQHVNKKLNEYRDRYRSIFLTSFRNSTEHYSRKRIGFDVLYRMINKAREELEC